MGELRQTVQTQLVLGALLQRPPDEAYGYAIASRIGLTPGTVYRILGRLEAAGWVESCGVEPGGARPHRRHRCLRRLTPAGRGLARAALQRST